MTTSEVPPAGRFARHVGTAPARCTPGRPATSWEEVKGGRRGAPAAIKQRGSLLDASVRAPPRGGRARARLLSAASYDVGAAAERIMRQAFGFLDDNVVDLRAQWSNARRVVLLRGDAVVAASVVEAHERAVLEALIRGGEGGSQQGYGSVLVATLIALGVRMAQALLTRDRREPASAAPGLHTPAAARPPSAPCCVPSIRRPCDAPLPTHSPWRCSFPSPPSRRRARGRTRPSAPPPRRCRRRPAARRRCRQLTSAECRRSVRDVNLSATLPAPAARAVNRQHEQPR